MDWIDSFVADTESLATHSLRLWTGISIIAATLERRVWSHTYKGLLYPNLYVLLAGTPGSGKSLMVNQAREFTRVVPELVLGPDNPTKRSFLDCLQKSVKGVGDPNQINGSVYNGAIYSAMYVASRELGVLISKYDPAFVNDLSDLWDNLDKYIAPRATTEDVELTKPTVNILGGVTPDFIGELFPDIAWGQGLTSRLMFIYGVKTDQNNIDVFKKFNPPNSKALKQTLSGLASLKGEVLWTDEAQAAFNGWRKGGLAPIPTYEKLRYYCERRESHILKLSMIAAISRHQTLTIEAPDFLRAKKWILDAESTMPDVFRAISLKTDEQIIKDLHQHFWTMYATLAEGKRKAIPKPTIWKWLAHRATSDKISKIWDSAVNAGYFEKSTLYSDHWVPKRLDQVGDLM